MKEATSGIETNHTTPTTPEGGLPLAIARNFTITHTGEQYDGQIDLHSGQMVISRVPNNRGVAGPTQACSTFADLMHLFGGQFTVRCGSFVDDRYAPIPDLTAFREPDKAEQERQSHGDQTLSQPDQWP